MSSEPASACAQNSDSPRPSSERTRLIFQTIIGLALRGVGIVAAFASQILIARTLGVTEFGVYVTVLTWATMLSMLVGFGVPHAGIRFLSTYGETRDWPSYRGFMREVMRSSVVTSVMIGIAVVLLFASLSSLASALGAMVVAAPLILLFAMSTLAQVASIAAHRPQQGELGNNLLRPLLIMSFVGASYLAMTPVSATGVAAMTTVAAILTLMVQWGIWWRANGDHWRGAASRADLPDWRASGRTYLISSASFALVERLDTMLLGIFVAPTEVGPYNAAAKLALFIGIALTPISALTAAAAARLLANDDRRGLQRLMAQMALLSGGCGTCLAAVLVVAAPHLLRAFGAGFAEARGLIVILLLGQFALTLVGPAGGLLAVAGRNRVLIGIMVSTALADVVLCLILIPMFGAMGAAVATCLSLVGNAIALAMAARILLHVDTTILSGIVLLARWPMHRGR